MADTAATKSSNTTDSQPSEDQQADEKAALLAAEVAAEARQVELEAKSSFDAGQAESLAIMFDQDALRQDGAKVMRRRIRKALTTRDHDELRALARQAVLARRFGTAPPK